jgi:hypothetical protein
VFALSKSSQNQQLRRQLKHNFLFNARLAHKLKVITIFELSLVVLPKVEIENASRERNYA